MGTLLQDVKFGLRMLAKKYRLGRFDRIEEFQAGKTGEIAVGGGKGGAMFDRQRGQVGVGDERSAHLSFDHDVAKNFPMPFARIQEGDDGPPKPVRNYVGRPLPTVERDPSNSAGWYPREEKPTAPTHAKSYGLPPRR